MHSREMTKAFHMVSRSTQDCEAICLQTIQYCLELGGAHAEPSHVQVLQDCADICQTTTRFTVRSSQHHADVTSACASLCDLCAASCERFAGDPLMKACANQCYLCASACRQMVSSGAYATGAAQGMGFAGRGAPQQRNP